MIRRVILLLALSGAAFSATAAWDPLQKAERAAARGARLLAEGDSLGAVNAYLEAQALRPDDPRIRMGLGEAFYGNGEYKSALGQFRALGEESAAPEKPLGLDALYNAGNSAFSMGDYQSALDLYTQALVAGSDDPDLLHNLELTQDLLEQAQSQQQQGEGESQEQEEGEESDEEDAQPQDGQQQEQSQEQQEQQQQEQEQEQPQEGEQQDEQQQQSAPPDSLAGAEGDSLRVPEGMSLAEALQLLDALDHDEQELRRSIMRRLRASETESEHDW